MAVTDDTLCLKVILLASWGMGRLFDQIKRAVERER